MIESKECRNCSRCQGLQCEVWLKWFRDSWANITGWYKGKPINRREAEKNV